MVEDKTAPGTATKNDESVGVFTMRNDDSIIEAVT